MSASKTAWAEYLKRAMAGTPQNKIAESAGVSPSQVSRWLRGVTVPSEKTVRQLVAGLGLSEHEAMTAAGHLLESLPAPPAPASSVPAPKPSVALPGFGAESHSGVMDFFYRGAKTRHLAQILLQARHGLLSPDWRDHLSSYAARWAPESANASAEAVAIAELQSRPIEPWEPHQAPWRQALDSWYLAARENAAEEYANMVRHHLEQVATGEHLARVYSHNNRLGVVILNSVAPLDIQRDRSREMNERLYLANRTKLTALYLAGLSAGGLDVDWKTWYLGEVEKWPEGHPGRPRHLLEARNPLAASLPEYWGWPDDTSSIPAPPATDIVGLSALQPGDRLIAIQRYGPGGEVARYPEGWVIKDPAAVVDGIERIEFDEVDFDLWKGAHYGNESLFHIQRPST